MMDMEFEKIKEKNDRVEVNTTATREHVGEIDRGIRLVKERSRWIYIPSQNDHCALCLFFCYDAECRTGRIRYFAEIFPT